MIQWLTKNATTLCIVGALMIGVSLVVMFLMDWSTAAKIAELEFTNHPTESLETGVRIMKVEAIASTICDSVFCCGLLVAFAGAAGLIEGMKQPK